jgi:hypothetical protein
MAEIPGEVVCIDEMSRLLELLSGKILAVILTGVMGVGRARSVGKSGFNSETNPRQSAENPFLSYLLTGYSRNYDGRDRDRDRNGAGRGPRDRRDRYIALTTVSSHQIVAFVGGRLLRPT